jgi:hypothetical protein
MARSVRVTVLAALVLLTGSGLAGCGGAGQPVIPPPTAQVSSRPAERDQLAGLAAAAKDKRYVATYTLSVAKRPDRTVTVAVGTDGSWLVAIPAGALGGLADVAMFGNRSGLYQCTLRPATEAEMPAGLGPLTRGCTAVTRLTPAIDPRVHHIFTDWIDSLVDRATALSVTSTLPLPGSSGACFSVESNSAALAPPLDPGVYCYAPDGLLTAARVGFGTLTLTGTVGAAPPTVIMPGPVVSTAPLAMTPAPAAAQ